MVSRRRFHSNPSASAPWRVSFLIDIPTKREFKRSPPTLVSRQLGLIVSGSVQLVTNKIYSHDSRTVCFKFIRCTKVQILETGDWASVWPFRRLMFTTRNYCLATLPLVMPMTTDNREFHPENFFGKLRCVGRLGLPKMRKVP